MRALSIPLIAMLLAGCAQTQVRDFAGDYAGVWSRDPPNHKQFTVHDLPAENRLKITPGFFASLGSAFDATVLLGFSNGVPSRATHEEAALDYLDSTNRGACQITDAAISPSGRMYEFHYRCEKPAAAPAAPRSSTVRAR